MSPASTTYENSRRSVPEPFRYRAAAAAEPAARGTSSASAGGEPPATTTSRVNAIVIGTDEPAAYDPAGAETPATAGGPSTARTTRSGSPCPAGTA